MNAYIASFMLLLFNAVGLAVPASAAAEERMIPELGSAANLSEVTDRCSVIEPARLGSSDHPSCDIVTGWISQPLAADTSANRNPVWAVVALRSEAGDKLEHEEGAP